jgi:SAM-dependent methyltransferase
MKLNIGGGDTELAGYENWDRKNGKEAAPLNLPDNSIDEIRASHVLEHFSHRSLANVLREWVRCLKPGGLLKIAVPDFEVLARGYLNGERMPLQQYVMGSHTDDADHHGAIFDEIALRDLMRDAGLFGICRWESEIEDCAALPVSLNLQGFKAPDVWPSVAAVMSCPRLGFMDNLFGAMGALVPLHIELTRFHGAFWEQGIERVITGQINTHNPEWILTLDYDSVFTVNDVQGLLGAVIRHPEVDAVAALQVHRKEPRPLMTISGEDGTVNLERAELSKELLKIGTAHFGLTLLKTEKLRQLPRPWFHSQPDPKGCWGEHKIDADIAFWKQWEAAGNSLYLANRVPIGHLELMIRWPDMHMKPIHQSPGEFAENGVPEGIWR